MDDPFLWRGKSSSGFAFRRENDLAVQLFQNSCVVESYKHLKTPQKRRNRLNGLQKPDKVSIFSLFCLKKVTFYFMAQFYPKNSMQCFVERSNSQRPDVYHKTTHFWQSRILAFVNMKIAHQSHQKNV